jgi:hypothetical protein
MEKIEGKELVQTVVNRLNILKDIATVQIIDSDKAKIKYLDFVYKPSIDPLDIPEIITEVKTQLIQTEPHPLSIKYTNNIKNDLQKYHNIDVNAEMVSLLIQTHANEIINFVFDKIKNIANLYTDTNFQYTKTKIQKFLSFIYKIFNKTYIIKYKAKILNDIERKIQMYSCRIYKKTLRGGANFIISSKGMFNILSKSSGATFVDTSKTEFNRYEFLGLLNNKFRLIVDNNMKYNDMSIYIGKGKEGNNEHGLNILINTNNSYINDVEDILEDSFIMMNLDCNIINTPHSENLFAKLNFKLSKKLKKENNIK